MDLNPDFDFDAAKLELQEWIINNKGKDWRLFFENKVVRAKTLYKSHLGFRSKVWDAVYYDKYLSDTPFSNAHDWFMEMANKNG
jgi:hypothetical protein